MAAFILAVGLLAAGCDMENRDNDNGKSGGGKLDQTLVGVWHLTQADADGGENAVFEIAADGEMTGDIFTAGTVTVVTANKRISAKLTLDGRTFDGGSAEYAVSEAELRFSKLSGGNPVNYFNTLNLLLVNSNCYYKAAGGGNGGKTPATTTYTISFVVNGQSVSREVAVPDNTYKTEGTIKAYILDYVEENIESIMGEIQEKIPSDKALDNFNYKTAAWTLNGKTITVTVPLKSKTNENGETPEPTPEPEPTPTPTEIEAEKTAAEAAGKFMVYFYADDTKSSVYTKAAVTAGGNATAPSNPGEKSENGKTYEFDGWEGAYTNIQGHTDIVAKWKEKVIAEPTVTMYTVTIVNPADNSTVVEFQVPAGTYVNDNYLKSHSLDGRTLYDIIIEARLEIRKLYTSAILGQIADGNPINGDTVHTYTVGERIQVLPKYTVTFTINDLNSTYDMGGTFVANNVEEGTKLSDIFGSFSSPNLDNPIGNRYYYAMHPDHVIFSEFTNLVINNTAKSGGIAGLTAADTVQGNTTITADFKLKDFTLTFDFGDRTETATVPIKTQVSQIQWSKLPGTIQNPTRASTEANGKKTTYTFKEWTWDGDGYIGFPDGGTTKLTATWNTTTKTVDLGQAGILNGFAADTRDLTFELTYGGASFSVVPQGADISSGSVATTLENQSRNGFPEQANDLKTAYTSVAEAYGTGTEANNAKFNQIATALTNYRAAMANVSDLRNYSSTMSTQANAVWDAIFGASGTQRDDFDKYLNAFKAGAKYIQKQRENGQNSQALTDYTEARTALQTIGFTPSGETGEQNIASIKSAFTEKINTALNISGLTDSATIRTLTDYLVNALAEDLAQFDGFISDLQDIRPESSVYTSRSPHALGVSTAQAEAQKASILMADFDPQSVKDYTGTAERAHTLLANFNPDLIKDGQRAIAQI